MVSPEYGTLNLMRTGIGKIREQGDDSPGTPPSPVKMPTIDDETVRRARLRAMRRIVAQGEGRGSTILGGSNTTLGGA